MSHDKKERIRHGEAVNGIVGIVRGLAQAARTRGENPRAYVEGWSIVNTLPIKNGVIRLPEGQREINLGPVSGFIPRMSVELRPDLKVEDADPDIILGDGSRRKIIDLE